MRRISTINSIQSARPSANTVLHILLSLLWPWYQANRLTQHGYRATIINSMWRSDNIWRQRSGSRLAQVMACCLTAPSHYLTNVDWSSVKSGDIHIRTISQEVPQPSIIKIFLKITCLKFHSNFPGANELTESGGGQPDGSLICVGLCFLTNKYMGHCVFRVLCFKIIATSGQRYFLTRVESGTLIIIKWPWSGTRPGPIFIILWQ